jgi:hypothetical protein
LTTFAQHGIEGGMIWTTARERVLRWSVAGALALICTRAAVGLAAQDDRAATQAILDELNRDTPHHAVVAESIARAQNALERGTRMRVAGDGPHAAQAEALARQWAETGRTRIRAAVAEEHALDVRRKALDTEGQVAKTREIVEEIIARTGRLRAQIAVERDAGPHARIAVEVHDAERDPSRQALDAADGGTP